jgi:hypothetical protein
MALAVMRVRSLFLLLAQRELERLPGVPTVWQSRFTKLI